MTNITTAKQLFKIMKMMIDIDKFKNISNEEYTPKFEFGTIGGVLDKSIVFQNSQTCEEIEFMIDGNERSTRYDVSKIIKLLENNNIDIGPIARKYLDGFFN